MAECGEQIRVGGKLSDGLTFRDVRAAIMTVTSTSRPSSFRLPTYVFYMVASANSPTDFVWPHEVADIRVFLPVLMGVGSRRTLGTSRVHRRGFVPSRFATGRVGLALPG